MRAVEFYLAPELLRSFFPLFQAGVELEVEVGCTIKQLLVEQLGIRSDYLASRITTLFLNSKAIDNAAAAVIEDGAVLALSGAMPGLVGATMRSGGHLAAMRGAMTHLQENRTVIVKAGRVKLKLFNLLLKELGPKLLLQGILLTGKQVERFFFEQPAEFRLRDCRIDNCSVTAGQLRKTGWFGDEQAQVKLKVYFGDEEPCRSQ